MRPEGFEPLSYGLKVRYSTIELWTLIYFGFRDLRFRFIIRIPFCCLFASNRNIKIQ